MPSPLTDTSEEPRDQFDRALGVVRRALRHYKAMLVMLVLGVVSAGVVQRLRPPTYRSETTILYTESMRVGETDGELTPQPRSTALRVQQLLKSRQILQRVIEELDLYPAIRRDQGLGETIDEMKKHVELRAPGGETFMIGFEGASPGESQTVTKRLSELVIEEDTGLRKRRAQSARDFLASEKVRVGKTLKQAEKELAGFIAEHPRFALDATPLQNGAAIRATTTIARPPPAAGVPARRPSRLPESSGNAAAPAPGRPAIDPEIARLDAAEQQRAEATLAAARADLADKRGRLTDAHPDVRAAVEAASRAERHFSVRPTGAEALAPVARPTRTSSSEKSEKRREPRFVAQPSPARANKTTSKSANSDVVTLETEWSRFTRALIEARQKHDQIEAAFFKAEIVASSTSSDSAGAQMTVIDPAFRPERPVPPGPRMMAAAMTGIGLALGLLLALGFAIVDDRIYDRRAVAGLAFVLVEVPRRRRRAQRRHCNSDEQK